jgi:hypothetical protein
MSPTPKTLAEELSEQIGNLEPDTLLTEFQTLRFIRECDKAASVDASSAWALKGMVYGMAGQPQKMISSFKNGLLLSSRNVEILINYIVALLQYGYFKEAYKICLDLLANIDSYDASSFLNKIYWISHRAAKALFHIGEAQAFITQIQNLQHIDADEKLAIGASFSQLSSLDYFLQRAGIDPNDATALNLIFFDTIQKNQIRINCYQTSYDIEENCMTIWYAAFADYEIILNFMNQYFEATEANGLSEVAYKITLCLAPHQLNTYVKSAS